MYIQVNNVIEKAIVALGLSDIINLDELAPTDPLPSELTLLLRCFNMTLEELAGDYFPLLKKETLTPVNGLIANANFSKPPVEIYSVKKNGEPVEYSLYPEGMHLSANTAHEIVYGYIESEMTIEETITVHPKVTEALIVLGTLMNYCIANGKYEDSLIYEKRFREAIREKMRKSGELKLPERRWI